MKKTLIMILALISIALVAIPTSIVSSVFQIPWTKVMLPDEYFALVIFVVAVAGIIFIPQKKPV